MRPQGTAQELERRRRRAVKLVEQGHGIRETAAMVGASPSSVSQWHAAYRADGEDALDARPQTGRPPKLTPKQCQQLERLLKRGPRSHGYATELWTLQRVVEVIEKRFGVQYDPSGVWHLLTRMGWSCQKPERRARERDEQTIVQWRKEDWPRIKKRQTKRQEHRVRR